MPRVTQLLRGAGLWFQSRLLPALIPAGFLKHLGMTEEQGIIIRHGMLFYEAEFYSHKSKYIILYPFGKKLLFCSRA